MTKKLIENDLYINGKLYRLAKHPRTGVYFVDPMDCPSTHGGSGYVLGSFMLDKDHIVCGLCGTIIEHEGKRPDYIL